MNRSAATGKSDRSSADFMRLTDLASERIGGSALAANDEFFAPKERLLHAAAPVFLPDEYTDRGKWMDGWETRRRRVPGHDWCVVRLGAPGTIHGVAVETTHFRGNHPEACSLDAAAFPGDPVHDDRGAESGWVEILARTGLAGDAVNVFPIDVPDRVTHVRLNIFPDGGVARLRVYGEARPEWDALAASGEPIDLASAVNGGTTLDCSDRFFSDPANLLMPLPPAGMHDGWETKRRRGPGHDWCVIRLGCRGRLGVAELDTTHFKGNYPESCSLDGAALEAPDAVPRDADWRAVLPRMKLQPHQAHRFELDPAAGPLTHVRLNIYPDGGVARLRLYGEPSRDS